MSKPRFTEDSVPDQTGRTVLITGANSGIGYEAARVLAAKGARILLGCRSEDKATAAAERILELQPCADLEFVELDLADLSSIAAAAQVVANEASLDLLVNNAGIMMPPRQETTDGFEMQFGVNHLGHFALTGLLLEKLLATDDSRVITISSIAHKSGRIHFDDLQANKGYSRQGRYSMSKLANLLFSNELQRRFEAMGSSTLSLAAHPGVSNTELSKNLPSVFQAAAPVLMWMVPNHAPPKAALPTLRAAVEPAVRGGEYFGPANFFEVMGPPEEAYQSYQARDPQLAKRLWEVSIELTGVDPGV